jgi:protein-L-isoaspartate(D-aspartate) O-methyltransferase
MDFQAAREQMVQQQVRAWEVLDNRVLEVLSAVPREQFAPSGYEELAFADIEIPLAHGQAMMTPKVEGRLLQALSLGSADEVLEIGTGSGFMTACLSQLADKILTVDIFPDFVDSAQQKLARLGIGNVQFEARDGLELRPGQRFDAIAVTGSVPMLTEYFIQMLRPGGRLFAVVGRPPVMDARLITMHLNGEWTEESLFETLLAPLVNAQQPAPFVL